MADGRLRLRQYLALLSSTSIAVMGVMWVWSRRRAKKSGKAHEENSTSKKPPAELHMSFDPKEMQPWDATRFRFIRRLQDACRNHGQVNLMFDTVDSCLVAVKQMPNWWICQSHGEFLEEHSAETELPWQDIGCVRFLESVGYPFLCRLQSVARDDNHTYLVFAYATEGDLFSMAVKGPSPGSEREMHFKPLVRQLFQGLKELHEVSVVHRDISPENVVCSIDCASDKQEIKLIDFGMALPTRYTASLGQAVGKPSYIAPEMHHEGSYDAFLADAFSAGVVVYALLLQDYPWITTKPGGCKRFEYVEKHGLRAYMMKQKVRGTSFKIGECMSEPLKELLIGLLNFDPAQRLTLGECSYPHRRRSVWDGEWLKAG